MKRESFARKVKNQIRKISLNELIKVIPSENNENNRILSKMEHLKYSDLKMQDYFKSKHISTNLARKIFRYRTRMIKLGANFPKSENLQCPLCSTTDDTQSHLLKCSKINNKENINYTDIFSIDSLKISKVVQSLEQAMENRKEILNERLKKA